MKKIIKSICFSLLAFMFAIGSIFLPVGKQNQNYANADNTFPGNTTFISSNLIASRIGNLPTSSTGRPFSDYIYSSSSGVNIASSAWYSNLSFKLLLDTDNRMNFYMSSFAGEAYGFGSSSINPGDFYPLGDFGVSISNVSRWTAQVNIPVSIKFSSSYSYTSVAIRIFIPAHSTPTLLMETIEISSIQDLVDTYSSDEFSPFSNLISELGGNNGNVVIFTDTAGFKYFFAFPTWIAYASPLDNTSNYFTYRKYYTTYNSSFNNNEYYNQGVKDGTAQGYDNGYNIGYINGSSVGYENGFENGKIEGALESNNYSFFGLISAVIDAPVKILTSLFNFNFLGVNLWAFFTSILTISLIIFVIRKFMAKG